MRRALHGILDRMREVIHRVDAPLLPRARVRDMRDAVNDRVTHVDVRGGHVDLCAQGHLSVFDAAALHLLKHPEAFFHGAFAVRIIFAGLRQRAAVFPDLLRRERGDISLAAPDQAQGRLIHFLKVTGGITDFFFVSFRQPVHVLDDGLHEFLFFLRGIRVVEAQQETAAVFLCDPGIQQDALRVADVQKAVRLRRKARLHMIIDAFL